MASHLTNDPDSHAGSELLARSRSPYPAYPTLVASGAAIRRRGALVELELLVKDTEPNRETDFMQQKYARATGFAKAVPPDSHAEVAT